MYWILSNELVDEYNDSDLTGEVNLELGDEICFDEGNVIERTLPKITLTLNEDSQIGKMTDHLSITELYGLVFSSRLRELMHNHKIDNIQYFDLEIKNPKTNDIYSDYKIANIVGLIDCVDKNKSDVSYFSNGNIKRIRKLVLNERRIPKSAKIFRLSNDVTLPIVHESVKKAFEVAGISGCLFYKVEDYH